MSTVVLPQLRREPAGALQRLHALERRFAPQVRLMLVLVGASGGWLLYRTGLWRVVAEPAFWWLGAMILLWLVFVLMLFVLGPLGILGRFMAGSPETDVSARLARMHHIHLLLLALAVVIVVGAVTGNHG